MIKVTLRNVDSVWESSGDNDLEAQENLLKLLQSSEPSDLIYSAIAIVENGIRFKNWREDLLEFVKFDIEYGKFTMKFSPLKENTDESNF